MTQIFNPAGIWVPKFKILEADMQTSEAPSRLSGEYTIKKYKVGFKEPVQVVGPFPNLLTDYGLNRVGTASFSEYQARIYVGTGSTPPAPTDVSLVAYRANSNSFTDLGVIYGGAPDYWAQRAYVWKFGIGAASGNLTEVGMGTGTATGVPHEHKLLSRALIVDSGGAPVTVTVLPDEYLDVTYAIRHYPHIPDVTQIINISGVSYTFTHRQAYASSQHSTNSNGMMMWTSSIGTYTGTSAGTPPSLGSVTGTLTNAGAQGACTPTHQSYSDGSLTRRVKITAGLSDSNLAYGIRGMQPIISSNNNPTFGFIGQYKQITISPGIPKDNTKVLEFFGNISWARKP